MYCVQFIFWPWPKFRLALDLWSIFFCLIFLVSLDDEVVIYFFTRASSRLQAIHCFYSRLQSFGQSARACVRVCLCVCVCVCEFAEKLNQKFMYSVFQKSDAKIEITITATNLIRIKYPLSSLNYHLSVANFANFNKIHCTVFEQQLFKKWNSKTEVSNMEKSP